MQGPDRLCQSCNVRHLSAGPGCPHPDCPNKLPGFIPHALAYTRAIAARTHADPFVALALIATTASDAILSAVIRGLIPSLTAPIAPPLGTQLAALADVLQLARGTTRRGYTALSQVDQIARRALL